MQRIEGREGGPDMHTQIRKNTRSMERRRTHVKVETETHTDTHTAAHVHTHTRTQPLAHRSNARMHDTQSQKSCRRCLSSSMIMSTIKLPDQLPTVPAILSLPVPSAGEVALLSSCHSDSNRAGPLSDCMNGTQVGHPASDWHVPCKAPR